MRPIQPDLEKSPQAIRVMKKSVPVEVTFAESDGVCDTLEGSVRFAAGDAILRGEQGETWPIELDKFLQTYEPVPPTSIGEPGPYVKKELFAWAQCLTEKTRVEIRPGSVLEGEVGDWLLQYAPGHYGIVSRDIFERSYAPA